MGSPRTRALRPREASIKEEKPKPNLRKTKKTPEENEVDVDPWLETSDWSSLFPESVLTAIKSSKTRKEWEIKLTVGVGCMGLQVRHVPAHRIPEVWAVLQPTTPGLLNAASERPLFEEIMKEMQAELSKVYEAVASMFIASKVGQEYLAEFWKRKYVFNRYSWCHFYLRCHFVLFIYENK